MDDQLRPHVHAAPSGSLTPGVAPLVERRRERAPRPESTRDSLGPALFSTAIITVGRWRCPVDHAVFADSGPARGHLFVFPRSSVWIEHEGQRRFVADPATVTYYNRGQRYRRLPLSPDGDRGEWFAVAPAVLADVLARRDPSAPERGGRLFAVTHGQRDRASYLAQRAVYEHVCHEEAPDPLFVEETMLAVLDHVIGLAGARCRRGTRRWSSHPLVPVAAGVNRDLAERAREVLAQRYADRMSLSGLAAAVDCSPFHLARLFRRTTGTTLHAHRTDLRLRMALEYLADPRSDLLELALSLGYSSHSHFTDVFRATYGTTPSELRGRLTRARVRDLAGLTATVRPGPRRS
jgi:AraC family transcriptional regulator